MFWISSNLIFVMFRFHIVRASCSTFGHRNIRLSETQPPVRRTEKEYVKLIPGAPRDVLPGVHFLLSSCLAQVALARRTACGWRAGGSPSGDLVAIDTNKEYSIDI